MTTDQTATLPDACRARATYVRDLAARHGIGPSPSPRPAAVAYCLAWDAPAGSEYPRPLLTDAATVALLWPELSDTVWHHAAGAVILGTHCCNHPAYHRDALVRLAQLLTGRTVTAAA